MTITVDPDILAKLEEKAKTEQRDVDAVANELLRQALEAKKPYKLELQGWTWDAELLVDVADRKKLYEDLYDDEYMRKRGFIE
jgi:predicted transcriptional regulator